MEFGFWKKLKEEKQKIGEPIFCLAPMADVTDTAFRRVIAKYSKDKHLDVRRPSGGLDVMWTEFVSADGLVLGGYEKLKIDLLYTDAERPIVAQLFGANPETMEKAARIVFEMGFDGLDINMGCPDRGVEKQGAGAALMKNPALAVRIIESARRGAPNIPISVKTRIGYNKNEIEEWLPALLKMGLPVVIIHARTRKEMSKVPAHWDVIKRAVEIRDEMKSSALIIGNGDVIDLDDARQKARESGCDGVMFGKAIFGRPWLFSNSAEFENNMSIRERLRIMVEHTKLFEELLMPPAGGGSASGGKNFAIMKKHYKAYLSGVASAKSDVDGFAGAKELRMKLMEAKNADEVEKITDEFLSTLH